MITKKHRLFIEAFEGNIVEAMRVSGFEGADNYLEIQGKKLLADPDIREAIDTRSKYLASTQNIIASRVERQAFWTDIMRNKDDNIRPEVNDKGVTKTPDNIPMAMRLKASELLGKSETDFIERVDVHHNLSISDVIKDAYSIPMDDLDAIEEEYERQYKTKKRLVVIENESDKPLGDNISESALGMYI